MDNEPENPARSPEESALRRAIIKQMVLRDEPPPRFVLFVDMLGFSQLTKDHPNSVVYNFESSDSFSSATSESADRLSRFLQVLNSIEEGQLRGFEPSHLMLFSDCAFLVFENALQAAHAATELMRCFFFVGVPVRIGLAYGTWNAERFSSDSSKGLTVTRAVFFGTGVVRAHEVEKTDNSDRGLRVFVHHSVTGEDLQSIVNADLLLPLDHTDAGPRELNYLHPNDGSTNDPAAEDAMLNNNLAMMRSTVAEPVPEHVAEHYAKAFAALNRMRRHLSREPFGQ